MICDGYDFAHQYGYGQSHLNSGRHFLIARQIRILLHNSLEAERFNLECVPSGRQSTDENTIMIGCPFLMDCWIQLPYDTYGRSGNWCASRV